MILSRRGFFTGLAAGLGVLAAPAIIKTPGLLMPVKDLKPRYRQVIVSGFGASGTMSVFQYEDDAGGRYALTPEGQYVPISVTTPLPRWTAAEGHQVLVKGGLPPAPTKNVFREDVIAAQSARLDAIVAATVSGFAFPLA